ncbi:MAG TPA: M55 family metallopeptidase [Oculatellaceae cyanobacterium]
MRIYLSVDMEGIHGVVHSVHTQPGERGYETASKWMHEDVNAVAAAAFQAGATEVYINDSHWDMKNLNPDLVHPKCHLLSGWHKPYSMVTGVKGHQAALFVGYHAKVGTAKGILSHTYRAKVFFDVRLNGKSVGEAGLNAALAGWFGVPIALITGDTAACRETIDLIGDVHHAVVKDGVSRYAGVCFPREQVMDILHRTTLHALKDASSWKLYKPDPPYTIGITFVDPNMADAAELLPIVKRTGDRDIEITNDDYSQAFQTMLAVGALGQSRIDNWF